MTQVALFVKHKTLPGKREQVRAVWSTHMAPAISANRDTRPDPDSICAFQQYASPEAAQDFLRTASYAAYLKEVEPLLSGPPQITALTPMWSKGA